MGKSKRNRKKSRRAANSPPPAQAIETSPAFTPRMTGKTMALIGLAILAIIIVLHLILSGNSGDIKRPAASPSSQPGASAPSQAGGSQPLSPSGSVDLQPTSSAAQAGSIQ